MSATATITWLGHSTVLVEIAGVRLLTDPVLTSSVAHLRRHRPVARPAPVDAVAISHIHMDHLHPRSLRLVTASDTRVIVPAGAAGYLRGVSATRVDEVRAGDRLPLSGSSDTERPPVVELEAVTAVHGDSRGPHTRRHATALGYVVHAGGRRIYFAGDTDLFEDMAAIGPVDVALLPIWGWGSTLGEHHLDPTTAVRATELLDATRVIPIHWGTYSPRRARPGPPGWLDRPVEHFRRALRQRGLEHRLDALTPGQSTVVG